jgi:hypothetical protein
VTDVTAALEVEASYDTVTVARVGGPLQVTVNQGGVDASSLQQGARIRASGQDVQVRDFRGVVEVEVERGGAHLAPGAPIADAVKVAARHGDIELEVPPNSRVDLQASARHGEVTSEVGDLAVSRADEHRLEARTGGGGHAVILAAEGGDVRIRAGIVRAEAARPEAPAVTAASPAGAPSSTRPPSSPAPAASAAPATPAPPAAQ